MLQYMNKHTLLGFMADWVMLNGKNSELECAHLREVKIG